MSLPQRSSSELPVVSSRNRQLARRRSAQQPAPANQQTAMELGSMMVVNLFISAVALVAIFQLVPHNASRGNKLQSLEAEVVVLEERVYELRKEFTRYFDPQQARSNMRQLSDRLEPGQRRIIFSDPVDSVESVPVEPVPTDEDDASQLTPSMPGE